MAKSSERNIAVAPDFPTPHLEKLSAALVNEKLPPRDVARIEAAIARYHQWIDDLNAVSGAPDEVVVQMVRLLDAYKFYVDVDLIFDSKDDFLYRQKGQLKLDNSVIEEFLPRLIRPAAIPEISGMNLVAGPQSCFSSVFFSSSLDAPQPGGGLSIRVKDQDFAISKPLYLKASHSQDFDQSVVRQTYIAYVATECKTNLDKTMFQEACATAHDTKTAVSGAKYYLLCEWLDMTPLSTAPTDIDEIIILRKAKRLSANVRKDFNTSAKRRARRKEYVKYLQEHPFRPEMFQRFINHLRQLLVNEAPVERDVLALGYF
jgi:hypothetical protein